MHLYVTHKFFSITAYIICLILYVKNWIRFIYHNDWFKLCYHLWYNYTNNCIKLYCIKKKHKKDIYYIHIEKFNITLLKSTRTFENLHFVNFHLTVCSHKYQDQISWTQRFISTLQVYKGENSKLEWIITLCYHPEKKSIFF